LSGGHNFVIGSGVPEARIVSPSTGTTVLAGTTMELLAQAVSPKSVVQSVEFVVDGASIGFGQNVSGTTGIRSIEWRHLPEAAAIKGRGKGKLPGRGV
jgi:hypothetical protein